MEWHRGPVFDRFVSGVRAALETRTKADRILDGVQDAMVQFVRDGRCRDELPEVDHSVDLYLDAEHLFCVSYGPYAPGRRIPPHDHGELGWAVYGLVEGQLVQRVYDRLDDGSQPGRADLRLAKTVVQRSGDVVVVPVGVPHETANEGDVVAWNFVIRSRRLSDIWRCQYRPDEGTVRKVKG